MKDFTKANQGRDLEDLITMANAQYRARKRAVIHKVPTEWVPERNHRAEAGGRTFVGAHVKNKAAVDYMGAYRGRALAFDAKRTKDLSTRMRWDRIEEHQAAFLEDWTATGSPAFILAGFALSLFLVIPWDYWRGEWARPGGPASFKGPDLAEAEPEMVVRSSSGIILDYLAAVDRFFFFPGPAQL